MSSSSSLTSGGSSKQSVKRKLIEPNEEDASATSTATSAAATTGAGVDPTSLTSKFGSSTSQMAKRCLVTTPLTSQLILKPRIFDAFMPPQSGVVSTATSYTEQLRFCNSFVYATCRDALNDEDIESKILSISLFLTLESLRSLFESFCIFKISIIWLRLKIYSQKKNKNLLSFISNRFSIKNLNYKKIY